MECGGLDPVEREELPSVPRMDARQANLYEVSTRALHLCGVCVRVSALRAR